MKKPPPDQPAGVYFLAIGQSLSPSPKARWLSARYARSRYPCVMLDHWGVLAPGLEIEVHVAERPPPIF
jgi:hypothetical protein